MRFFDYPDGESRDSSEQIVVLEDLTDDDWKTLSKFSQNVHFSPGEILVNAGDVDEGFFILVNGYVEVIGKSGFGRDKILAEIHEGSIFGELSFFDHQPRSAAIRAVTEGNVLHLTRHGFDQLTAWNPGLARQLLLDLGKVLAYRFRQATADGILE